MGNVRLKEMGIVARERGRHGTRVSVGEQEETVKPSNKREIGQDGSRSTRRPAHMAGSGLGLWQVCTRRHMGRRGSWLISKPPPPLTLSPGFHGLGEATTSCLSRVDLAYPTLPTVIMSLLPPRGSVVRISILLQALKLTQFWYFHDHPGQGVPFHPVPCEIAIHLLHGPNPTYINNVLLQQVSVVNINIMDIMSSF